MPMVRKLNTHFFKTWSPDMAYVFGFFAADGNMIMGKRGNYYISFHITDKKLLKDIQKVLGSSHKISTRIREDKNWSNGYRLQIGSKEMFHDLVKLGMTPKKSLTLKFPKVQREYLPHFIRGYFDGDGCVYFKKHFRKDRGKMRWVFSVRFISGSRIFLERLHKILHGVTNKGFILDKQRGHELVFSHLDGLALYRFMYNNVRHHLCLDRKLEIFKKAVKTLYGVE